jgi:hypothetical protein
VYTMKATAVFSPTYTAHPNLVERVNQTLIHSMRNYVADHHKNWDDYLDSCTAGYNQRYQDSLKISPHEAVFGYKPRIPQFTDITNPVYKKAKTHFKRLDKLRKQIKLNLETATKASTERVNAKREQPTRYYPGEMVLILKPRKVEPKSGLTKKFRPHYEVIYKVVERLSDVTYKVVPYDKPGDKPQIAHVSKMKRYFSRPVNNIRIRVPKYSTPVYFQPGKHALRKFSVNVIMKSIDHVINDLDVMINPKTNIRFPSVPIPYIIMYGMEKEWRKLKWNFSRANPHYYLHKSNRPCS